MQTQFRQRKLWHTTGYNYHCRNVLQLTQFCIKYNRLVQSDNENFQVSAKK